MDDTLASRVLDLALAIQQIPTPTFDEGRRADFVRQQFLAEGLADVSTDNTGNVYARLPGEGTARPVVVSAHLDTVFPPDTDLAVRRTPGKLFGPGIGDNSLGIAALLGLVWGIRGNVPPGDVWLAANVCEEGLGDLRGMKSVVARFGDTPLAYIVLEGMSLGKVYIAGMGVQRYRISIQTPGGHSWSDFGRPSAIHELAALATRLTVIPLPERPRTTLNVGVISGGTTVNTIAAEAHLELDLRSEGRDALAKLAAQVESLARAANRRDVTVRAEIIGQRPAGEISPEHPLVRLAQQRLIKQRVEPELHIGSTDANLPLSLGLPAVCIGLTTGGGAHTTGEFIHTRPLAQGLAQLVGLVEGVFREMGQS